nr:MAG TPA: hypothetical protein [Caudoviricetes sp.]DAL49055.1 MAG TPA_asm: hypothetical protein [Caudoviricetes sp.]
MLSKNKTKRGVTVERDNIKRTSFYSTVKGIYHGKVSLDRATKNSKKDITYIAL